MLLLALFIISISCLALLFFSGHLKHRLKANETKLIALQEQDAKLQEELSANKEQLQHAFIDPVTQLTSWSVFEDRLQQNIKESERYHLNLGVLFVDIDDFRIINEALGYETSNNLLSRVAKRLQACIRQVDSISRFQKDTFVILLTQLIKAETAAVVAQRILQEFNQPFKIDNQELFITIGIGIALFPSDGKDPAALLQNADHALQLAKQKGKHLYQFYQEKMHSHSERELAMLTNLRRDSFYPELNIYYQPIFDIKTKSIFCMDVLLIWEASDIGVVTWDSLYPYAEKQHKANAISEWLLHHVCSQFLHWRSLNFEIGLLGIQVSIKQLEDSHFIYSISHILQQLNFKPEWLLLQIKESTTQISFDILEKSFNMLTYLGVKLSIDHFGSGLFSLSYLKNIQINFIRLDPTFINDLLQNQQSLPLLKGILLLAQAMNIQIIIQEVEVEEQARLLKNLGYTLLQGNLLSPPIKASEVEKQLNSLSYLPVE